MTLAKYKIIAALQLHKSNVKVPTVDDMLTIQDNNQAIHNGVIHETNASDLRSQVEPKRKGRKKSKRQD